MKDDNLEGGIAHMWGKKKSPVEFVSVKPKGLFVDINACTFTHAACITPHQAVFVDLR